MEFITAQAVKQAETDLPTRKHARERSAGGGKGRWR
jgi:hypothetical protein